MDIGYLIVFAMLAAGCHREAAPQGDRTPPNPSSPALYGPPAGTGSKEIPRALSSGAGDSSWRSAPFHVVQTELSPATLVHSSGRHLHLFTGLTNHGLSAPAYVAWPTMNGPRTFKCNESFTVTNMTENWVLVWWAGAEGWSDWDSPWVVYLQHQPDAMKLDGEGLHLEFPRAAGDVVVMPLYGCGKPPQEGRDFRARHGLPQPKVQNKTWEWPKVITREPLTRIRYWASATREFPLHCEESFTADRARDSVTIRSRFRWHSIDDDWKTRHIKLAPLSPPLGHVAKLGGFPVQFSRRWFDLEMPTPFGPYVAIEGVDEFDATLSVLQYVNESEAFDPPGTNASPQVQHALDRLWAAARQVTQQPGALGFDGATANWLGRALGYLDDVTRSNTLAALRKVLNEEAAPAAAVGLEALWASAHFTGDRSAVKRHWPQVKKSFAPRAGIRWAAFGRADTAALGQEAGQCAAFARVAYMAGDVDAYNHGCFLFARQLALLFLKQRGADYFRQQQPWHSLEFMDEEVFLTRLADGPGGWQLDGPKYPHATQDRLFDNRWAQFNDWDVARFCREYLKEDVRRELNWLQHRWPAERRWQNDPAGQPSLVQLRSLLLNETPAELAALLANSPPAAPPWGQIANSLSILRASHPTRYERLVPPGDPSAFVTGLEREMTGPKADLVAAMEYQDPSAGSENNQVTWPRLTWPNWKTSTGAAWTFGHIQPVREGKPRAARVVPLNWNTRVIVFDLP